jgi:hypothetical protein
MPLCSIVGKSGIALLEQATERHSAAKAEYDRSAALANYWALKIPQSYWVCWAVKRFNEKPRLLGQPNC